MADVAVRLETFTRWFLRFNGYFSVENFIVHDPGHISGGNIAQRTETDLLAIRMPHSKELKSPHSKRVEGPLYVANFPPLTAGGENKIDVVIGEVKSGDSRPNKVWKGEQKEEEQDLNAVEYIVRFIGLFDSDEKNREVAATLKHGYRFENSRHRFRFLVFCKEPNPHYSNKGVTYVTFDAMIQFLVKIRGQSWLEANIGVASRHEQWDALINSIFAILNRTNLSIQDKCSVISVLLFEC